MIYGAELQEVEWCLEKQGNLFTSICLSSVNIYIGLVALYRCNLCLVMFSVRFQ